MAMHPGLYRTTKETAVTDVPKIERIFQPVEIQLGNDTWTGVVERIHWNHNRIVVSVDFLSVAEFERRTREQIEALGVAQHGAINEKGDEK